MKISAARRTLALCRALVAEPFAIAQSPEGSKGERRILVGFIPGGTVDAIARIVARRNQEIAKVLGMRDVRERLRQLGQEPVGSTPEEPAKRTATEAAKWVPIVKASGFSPDQ